MADREEIEVGKHFLTFHEDGKVNWSGVVLEESAPGRYTVLLRDWHTGNLTSDEKEVGASESMGWQFFDSDEDARREYERLKREGRAG